jgi:dihydroorotase
VQTTDWCSIETRLVNRVGYPDVDKAFNSTQFSSDREELYDLLIKNGTVVDPSLNIHERMDVAVRSGRIEDLAKTVSGNAHKTLDASGLIVTPGLIDMHAHVAHNVIGLSVDPEETCLRKGSTTVVDAGSTGELNFTPFREYVVRKSAARVLGFINIESLGMIEFGDFSPNNTDQKWPELLTALNELFAHMFVNVENTEKTIVENRSIVPGLKWAHHGLRFLEYARQVADKAGCIIMAENHYMPVALKYLKKGDIITHAYHYVENRITRRRDGLTEDGSTIHPEFLEAVRRGVLLDVGHGKASFSWRVAELALKDGLEPHMISTDLWKGNVNGPVFDLPTTMVKFLCLGLSLERVVEATTSKPASALGRLGELGTLKPGARADIAAFRLVDGDFPLVDSQGDMRKGISMLVPIHVVKEGEILENQ